MFEWYDHCFSCKKKKFFVRKRKIRFFGGTIANSREKLCKKCFVTLQAELDKLHG